MMANQQSQQRQQEPQETPGQAALRIATALVIILLGIALFIALIGAIIGGWSFIEHAGIWLVLGVLVVGGVTWQFPRIHTHMATTSRENKLNDAQVKLLEAKAYRLTRILPMSDDQGNALINDPETHVVGAYRGQMRQFTALTSFHNTQKYTGLSGQNQIPELPPGNMQRISIDDATRHITQQLESCLGSSLRNNGAPILGDWSESHILIIGSTRMGKSCEAGNILKQAEKIHSPSHLQIAMLDAEYKTSRLFEHSPLLLKLDVRGRRITMHAKSLEEVPAVLHLLALEAERRDRLEEWELAELPHILAYFEEFLNTKKQIKARFPKQFDTFLTDFNMLTTRGVKLGIHLMLCAQVNYADEDLRDSMAQFSGLNISFCVNPTAARSAGFVETDLLNENYRAKQKGQFVVESMSGNDIGLAPDFDVKERVKQLSSGRNEMRSNPISTPFHPGETTIIEEPGNGIETGSKRDRNGIGSASQANLEQKLRQVHDFLDKNPGATGTDIIKAVWNVKPGKGSAYEQARREYVEVQKRYQQYALRGMQQQEEE